MGKGSGQGERVGQWAGQREGGGGEVSEGVGGRASRGGRGGVGDSMKLHKAKRPTGEQGRLSRTGQAPVLGSFLFLTTACGCESGHSLCFFLLFSEPTLEGWGV